MVRSDNWDELDSVVTDDVLDEVQPSASYEELPALVTSRLSGLVSGFVLDLPYEQTDDDEFRDTIKAIQTIKLVPRIDNRRQIEWADLTGST